MLKKIVLVTLMTLPICSWGSGFYAGLGLGADTADFSQTAYIQRYALPVDSFNVTDKTQLAAQDIFGTAFVGYGKNCGRWYLGGELNGNLSAAQFHSSNEEVIHNNYSKIMMSINRSWGVSALPGVWLPGTTLLYGRVGYSSGHFEIKSSDSSIDDADQWLNGLRWGLGVEKKLCKNLGLRLEYSHIHYNDFRGETLDPISNTSKQTVISPDTNQFELGVVYRFC